jgi:hypothetical protein
MVAVMVTVPVDAGHEPVGGHAASPSSTDALISLITDFATAGFLQAGEVVGKRHLKAASTGRRKPRRGINP